MHARIRTWLRILYEGQDLSEVQQSLWNRTSLRGLMVGPLVAWLCQITDYESVAWESPRHVADAANLILLLSELRERLPEGRFLLTASFYHNRFVDLRNTVPYLDLVNVKCFDFGIPDWSKTVRHNSQMNPSDAPGGAGISCYEVISFYQNNGVPLNKVMFGIPAFGRGWPGASQMGAPWPSGKPGTVYPVSMLPQFGR